MPIRKLSDLIKANPNTLPLRRMARRHIKKGSTIMKGWATRKMAADSARIYRKASQKEKS